MSVFLSVDVEYPRTLRSYSLPKALCCLAASVLGLVPVSSLALLLDPPPVAPILEAWRNS